MKPIFYNLCRLLKKSRSESGLTQAEVGDKLGYESRHQYISNWERELSPPPYHRLPEIMGILGIDESRIYKAFMKDKTEEYDSLKIPKRNNQ